MSWNRVFGRSFSYIFHSYPTYGLFFLRPVWASAVSQTIWTEVLRCIFSPSRQSRRATTASSSSVFSYLPSTCIGFFLPLFESCCVYITLLNYVYRLRIILLFILHYMFRPQRVIFRCSIYITLLLLCAFTHFFLSHAGTFMCIYTNTPPCNVLLFTIYYSMFFKQLIINLLKIFLKYV
jgi:hypothetical protein